MTVTEPTQSAQDERAPWWLRGNYAPVFDEITAVDLPVEGKLPEAIEGTYIRNGANPKTGTSMHWFDGDGMLHGIKLREGKVSWYRNRWVQTPALHGADRMAAYSQGDFSVGRANTHVWRHAGRLLALEEGAWPVEFTDELETVGSYTFDGKLSTVMTAHPHTCPETGEMHFFAYGFLPPYLTYHVADAQGRLIRTEEIPVAGATMIHDFAISRNHAIFFDLPLCFDLDAAINGGFPFAWKEDYGARIGLLRRDGSPGSATQWFDVEPGFVFHIMNAYEDAQGRVVLDAGRHPSMWRNGPNDFDPCYLHRWTFDPATGRASEQQLDDVNHAFPRHDERRVGLGYRYGWAVGPRDPRDTSMGGDSTIVRYDVTTGERLTWDLGAGTVMEEPTFVPASDTAAEGEGWLVAYAYDRPAGESSFVVLDATDPKAAPVARVRIPQRIPHGFHGNWFPA